MATAFTSRERERIDQSLMDAALRFAASGGMRHCTVDELAREAGISKGAFYGFYKSKEHLFLSMLERLHGQMYGSAEQVLEARRDLPIRQRATLAIQSVCETVRKSNISAFLHEELPLLLRRLPESDVRAHYLSDEERIRALIAKAEVSLNTSVDTACAVVRLLLMSFLRKNEVGERFDDALRLMIEGSCQAIMR